MDNNITMHGMLDLTEQLERCYTRSQSFSGRANRHQRGLRMLFNLSLMSYLYLIQTCHCLRQLCFALICTLASSEILCYWSLYIDFLKCDLIHG
eukprot:c8318_g1_i1 orf=13-294(-)